MGKKKQTSVMGSNSAVGTAVRKPWRQGKLKFVSAHAMKRFKSALSILPIGFCGCKYVPTSKMKETYYVCARAVVFGQISKQLLVRSRNVCYGPQKTS